MQRHGVQAHHVILVIGVILVVGVFLVLKQLDRHQGSSEQSDQPYATGYEAGTRAGADSRTRGGQYNFLTPRFEVYQHYKESNGWPDSATNQSRFNKGYADGYRDGYFDR